MPKFDISLQTPEPAGTTLEPDMPEIPTPALEKEESPQPGPVLEGLETETPESKPSVEDVPVVGQSEDAQAPLETKLPDIAEPDWGEKPPAMEPPESTNRAVTKITATEADKSMAETTLTRAGSAKEASPAVDQPVDTVQPVAGVPGAKPPVAAQPPAMDAPVVRESTLPSKVLEEAAMATSQSLETVKNKAQELLSIQEQLVNQLSAAKSQAQNILDTNTSITQQASLAAQSMQSIKVPAPQSAEPAKTPEPPKPVVKSPKKISREVAVRYYSRMHPACTLPLNVLFSRIKAALPSSVEIKQVEGKPVEVKEEHSLVKVLPQIPGCLAVPNEVLLDIAPAQSSAKFWITPLTEGKITEAQVEIWYESKCVQRIPISLHVVKQWPAKLAVACGFLSPLVSLLYEKYGGLWLQQVPELIKNWLQELPRIAAPLGGILNLGLAVGGGLMLLAILLAFFRRTKKARPAVGVANLE
jgi:hypothetical protein